MKKYDLLKILIVTFLIVFVLSWIIPAGHYSGTVYVNDGRKVLGIFDLFYMPVATIITFFQYGFIFLAIGGFYGVLAKTGAYSKLIDRIVGKIDKNNNRFLVITVILFSLISSLTGLMPIIFLLVPFFAAILMKLGYSKITTLAATVGSALVGTIGATYAINIHGYFINVFTKTDFPDLTLSINNAIFVKIIVYIMVTALYTLLVVLKTKKVKVKNEEITFYEKEGKTNKKELPLVIISLLTILILFVGMYSWKYVFNINIFTELFDKIKTVKIGDFAILDGILGNLVEFGNWGNYEFIMMLGFASIVIGFVYEVGLNSFIDGFIDGIKKMSKVAIYAVLANIVFAVIINVDTNNIVATLNNFIFGEAGKFSVIKTTIATFINSLFYNDYMYLLYSFASILKMNDLAYYELMGILISAIYGLTMMIAPTSIFLLAGLSYFNVSYKDWIKHIWKYLLLVLLAIVAVCLIIVKLI